MRNIVLYLQLSLDGVVSDVEDWGKIGEDILANSLTYYATTDTVLFGGNAYPSMAEYWQKAEQDSTSAQERELAAQLNAKQKFVISHKPVELSWRNSGLLLAKDDASLVQQVQQLKAQAGKSISVESGVQIWQFFLKNDLFDELYLSVHPIIVGKGDKLFDDMHALTKLTLIHSETLESGVVVLHYKRRI